MSVAADLHRRHDDADLRRLARLVSGGGVLVLSGAGLSTESGIPDYRGPTGRLHPATPMTYQEFTGSAAARQRYWARSHRGWQRIQQAEPNDGHAAVARLQRAGLLSGVVTQNVDGLHQAAGARGVVELHGGLDRVVCLSCRAVSDRDELDERLVAANPGARAATGAGPVKPDGDVELAEPEIASFRLVDCLTAALARSSRMWCSSERTCRRNGWPGATPWSRQAGCCWCWARP